MKTRLKAVAIVIGDGILSAAFIGGGGYLLCKLLNMLTAWIMLGYQYIAKQLLSNWITALIILVGVIIFCILGGILFRGNLFTRKRKTNPQNEVVKPNSAYFDED